MGISISTYYYKSKRTVEEDAMILRKIEAVCQKVPMVGYRKVAYLLGKEQKINHKRVYRIMSVNKLLCRKIQRRRQYTTDSKHKLRRYPNLLKSTKVEAPGQAMVGDVTAYDICGKDYYLASLMDVYSRRILGFAVSDKNNTALMRAALEMAKSNRDSLESCIHHTDSDVRYCSKEYTGLLKKYKMKISMCVGNAYENAFAESLNAVLKREEIRISDHQSKQASVDSLEKYVSIYNEYRPHGSIGYLSPMEFEAQKLFFEACFKK